MGLPIEVLVAGAEGVGEIADIGAVGRQLSVHRQEDIQCLLWIVWKEGECLLLFEPCGVGFGSDSEVSEGQDMFACAGFVFGDGGELGLPDIGEVECFVVFVGEVGILFGVDGVEDIECSGVVATYGKAVGDMDVGMLLLLGRGGEPICLVGIGKCGVVVEAVVLLP